MLNSKLKTLLYLIILNIITQNFLFSQCSITVDAGPDQFECSNPATFILDGEVTNPNTTILSTVWTPTTGLSDPNSLNTEATISTTTTYYLQVKGVDFNDNLVINGDFSDGNTGFSTDYTYNPNPSIPFNQLMEGYYTIGSEPAPMHVNWEACGDHTTGTGNMMLVNGHETPDQDAWCQTVNVTPNTEYVFSVWVASVDPNGPCEIQFNINGTALGSGNVGLTTPCLWINFFEFWNSGSNTTATICIEDINTIESGNDFAIDDIVFAPTCTDIDSVTLTLIELIPFATNNGPFCEGDILELSADGGDTYQWSGPDGYYSDGQYVSIEDITLGNAGIYTVTVTDSNGCTETATTEVLINSVEYNDISMTTCNPNEVGSFSENLITQYGCDSIVTTTITLNPSNTVNLFLSTCDTTEVGIFIENLTNQYGCDSTVTTTVTLNPSNLIDISLSTCDSTEVGVFTENLINQYGCDSTIITSVTLLPSNITDLIIFTCDSSQIGVFTENLTNQYGCDSIVTTTVEFLENNIIYINESTCDSSTVGVFTEALTNQSGCDSTVITTISLLPPSHCNLTFDVNESVIPCGENSGSLTIEITLGEPPFEYIITGPTNISGTIQSVNVQEVIQNLPAGEYSISITSSTGITTNTHATITQNFPPDILASVTSDYNGNNISCAGENDGSASVSVTGGTAPFQYEWSNGDTFSNITQLEAGSYFVTVTDINGCIDSSQITLIEPDTLNITYSIKDLDCSSQNNGEIISLSYGGTMPFLFNLNDSISQPNGDFHGLTAGEYKIQVIDANGCTTTQLVSIADVDQIYVDLGEDLYIEYGETVELNAIVNVSIDSLVSIKWNPQNSVECPDCLVQNVEPQSTTTYIVAISDANGCSDEDSITVYVEPNKNIYIPDVFSPNLDGINDVFTIYSSENSIETIKTLKIFNRWGEMVFSQSNMPPNDNSVGWDGSFKGHQLNPGVFVWLAKIIFIDGSEELFSGDVTILK